jgi:oxygen-independent coproporphyrinogen-3 oxidase
VPDPLGLYVHVPFCAARCGYCDFNTYTAAELRGGVRRDGFARVLAAEVALQAARLGDDRRPVDTVFFGGGTPTLLPPEDLAAILGTIRDQLGLAADAEVTTEANPESVHPASLAALREAGFTRISLGMQSAAASVLATLDRVHTPGRAIAAAHEARAAGFEHVSLDLIYGTPGETDEDWERSLDAVLEAQGDHVSAYGLQVEAGTRMAAQVRRGELPAPDDDAMARRYERADERLSAAGLRWYEVSNWAADDDARCRHNLGYWRSSDWLAVGPGAHGHLGGRRWWNVRHPSAYAERVGRGEVPVTGEEVLDEQTRRFEAVMLEVRLDDGLDPDLLSDAGRRAASRLRGDGLLEDAGGRLRLTRAGRLRADAVVRDLTD